MQAERAAREAESLIRNLIDFSRGGAPAVEKRSIAELIKETVNLIYAGPEYTYEFSLSDNLSLVEIDAGQIKHAIVNIILNAMDAMPDGGVIRIGAEEVNIGPESNVSVRDGSYVKISISDHGCGISEEILPKIFDPYFTTKFYEKGKGFGLATCYSIIKNHFGDITVESEPGKGTTFHIYLPLTREHKVRKRIPISMDIVFGVTNVEIEDDLVKDSEGKLVDISSGGVGLLASSSLQEGQEITIRFSESSIPPLHGRVKWVRRVEGQYRAGVEERY
jgi:anti-sigma regulatory factor (Ser/Thr protein kinase)